MRLYVPQIDDFFTQNDDVNGDSTKIDLFYRLRISLFGIFLVLKINLKS